MTRASKKQKLDKSYSSPWPDGKRVRYAAAWGLTWETYTAWLLAFCRTLAGTPQAGATLARAVRRDIEAARAPIAPHGVEPCQRALRRIERALFLAWQAGDLHAREVLWTLLWTVLFPMAVGFCRRFCRDLATAEAMATAALADAWVEVEQKVADRQTTWVTRAQFVGLVQSRVTFRCRDEARDAWRWDAHLVAGNAIGQGANLLGPLAGVAPAQAQALDYRDFLRRIVTRLAGLRECCVTRKRAKLVEFVDAIIAYFRHCLIKALPDRIDGSRMNLDQLADAAMPGCVELTQSELYDFIEQHLKIGRGVIFSRMNDLLKLLAASAVGGRGGVAPGAGNTVCHGEGADRLSWDPVATPRLVKAPERTASGSPPPA